MMIKRLCIGLAHFLQGSAEMLVAGRRKFKGCLFQILEKSYLALPDTIMPI